MIHQESKANWTDLVRLFIKLGAHVLSVSEDFFASHIMRMHKDVNDAIEHARSTLLPSARPCGDGTHMYSRFALNLVKKCSNSVIREPTVASAKTHEQQISDGMRCFCGNAPKIHVLDAVLEVALEFWRNVLNEPVAVDYFTIEKYVEHIDRQSLERWKILIRSPDREQFNFCEAWVGLFANFLPGMECGSQPIESFHSVWERRRLSFGGREDVSRILHTMQGLYANDSAFTDMWYETSNIPLHSPTNANPDLLSGDALRQGDLSPASDYIASDIVTHKLFQTDSYRVVAVQNCCVDGCPAAKSPLNQRNAAFGVAAMHAHGESLNTILFEAGVFFRTTTNTVGISVSNFNAIFEDIAYVVLSPLPPNLESLNKPLCTCRIYGTQQQCQHTLFVEGPPLDDLPIPRDFEEAVHARKPGRPKGKAKTAPKAKRRHQ